MGRMSPVEILMALTVPLVWGMGLVLAKGAIEQFPPILLMGFRFTLTALLLVWFVPIPRKNLVWLFFTAIVASAIQYSLAFTGLKGLDAGIAALIVQLEVPFLVILGALLLAEPSPHRSVCASIALLAAAGTNSGAVDDDRV